MIHIAYHILNIYATQSYLCHWQCVIPPNIQTHIRGMLWQGCGLYIRFVHSDVILFNVSSRLPITINFKWHSPPWYGNKCYYLISPTWQFICVFCLHFPSQLPVLLSAIIVRPTADTRFELCEWGFLNSLFALSDYWDDWLVGCRISGLSDYRHTPRPITLGYCL
jgi:hypothetical protein